MNQNNTQQKEPSPTTETVSSNSKIPKGGYTTSARKKQKTMQRLRDRLKDPRYARVPGRILTGEWNKQIGPAWPLLLVILCLCDWDKGELRTYEWALAELLNQSPRNIRNWLNRLRQIHGFEVIRLRYGIEIHLPDHLVPNRDRKKSSGQGKFRQKPDL